MAGCLDHCRMPQLVCCEKLAEKRNAISSMVSGALVSVFRITQFSCQASGSQLPAFHRFVSFAAFISNKNVSNNFSMCFVVLYSQFF